MHPLWGMIWGLFQSQRYRQGLGVYMGWRWMCRVKALQTDRLRVGDASRTGEVIRWKGDIAVFVCQFLESCNNWEVYMYICILLLVFAHETSYPSMSSNILPFQNLSKGLNYLAELLQVVKISQNVNILPKVYLVPLEVKSYRVCKWQWSYLSGHTYEVWLFLTGKS